MAIGRIRIAPHQRLFSYEVKSNRRKIDLIRRVLTTPLRIKPHTTTSRQQFLSLLQTQTRENFCRISVFSASRFHGQRSDRLRLQLSGTQQRQNHQIFFQPMHTMASTNHEQKFSSRCTELLNSAAVSTALALANKTGLLEAMLNDETPRSSHEWGTRCLIHFKTSHDILQMLHSGEVSTFLSCFLANQSCNSVNRLSHVSFAGWRPDVMGRGWRSTLFRAQGSGG